MLSRICIARSPSFYSSSEKKLSPCRKMKHVKSSTNLNLLGSPQYQTPSLYNFPTINSELKQTKQDYSLFSPENDISKSISNSKKVDKQVQTSFSSEGFSIKKCPIRWVVSFCDCLMNISKFYCMDSPQALQSYFYRGSLKLSSTEYNLFYSIFAFFFLLTFFSGYFVEKKGVRFCYFLFSLFCFIGHFFFTLGGSLENYLLMLLGRLIFGIGCSCVEICQDLIVTEWFFDKELALALGLSFGSCRLGSALTMLFTPKIMIFGDYFDALLVGLMLSFLGVVCSLIIVIIDRNYDEEKGDLQDLDSFIRDFSFIENGLTIQKLKEMGGIFWIMVFNAMFAYACYFGFVNNSNDILCTLYGYTPQEAGEIVVIMYFSAALTPIFGFILERIGKRINILSILLVFLMAPFVNIGVLPESFSNQLIVPSLIFIGVFFSSYAAVLWSFFPLLIEARNQCMAFAIIYATLNISLILASFFVGVSIDILGDDQKREYNWAFLSMILCLIMSFCLVLKIRLEENQKVHALNSYVTNNEIRNIINEDQYIGQKLLEMIDVADRNNSFEIKQWRK